MYTSQITKWIAAEDFAWYCFEGLKDLDNQKLHITSYNFDEPTVLLALQEAHTVLTIHGLKNTIDEFIMIGGLDTALGLSLIHISEPTRLGMISYAVFCLKKKKKKYP